MNIFATKGDKVIVTEKSAKNGYNSDFLLVKEHLIIGGIYTVDYTKVESWHTSVYLKEFPHLVFNSVNFEDHLSKKNTIKRLLKIIEWYDENSDIRIDIESWNFYNSLKDERKEN